MGALQITIKTLQQKQFKLDVDTSDSILSVKEKIEQSQGHPVAQQKLIFSGKILVDDKKVEEYNISEKDFLVVMVSKPKATTSAASTPKVATPTEAKPQEATPAPAPAAAAAAAAAPVAVPEAPVPEAPAPTTESPSAQPENTDTSLVTGSQLDSVIQNLMEMGFEREQCVRALRASFNNPDRAVEYLFNGIPQHILDEMNANQQAQQEPAAAAATAGATSPSAAQATSPTTDNASGAPLNLFAAAQQQAQQQQQQQQSAGGNTDFSGLRNTPHFQQIRQLVQSNPALLQPLLQQLGQSNPELLRSINADPNGFLQTLLEGAEDEEGAPPGSSMIQVTQEEKDAIDRLMALGFPRHQVIEAYFACDKNEELAANYLFEQPFGDDEE
ncbi:Zinc transporter [Mucor velutinosus]|uniref:UV excision repair protein RAD23 n=1 Tax=Mucor velutinosus TaxID=708070 RepID=A0AAN7DGE3_9FUNG|nr:Zinc transporter [Mucor velutinosus]